MPRIKRILDAETGEIFEVPFTVEEEAIADAVEARPAPTTREMLDEYWFDDTPANVALFEILWMLRDGLPGKPSTREGFKEEIANLVP